MLPVFVDDDMIEKDSDRIIALTDENTENMRNYFWVIAAR